MKRLLLTGIATLAVAVGAFAQGTINLTDNNIGPGLASGTAGAYYTGTFGLEVWESNGTVPTGVNVPGGMTGYDTLIGTAGFKLEQTYVSQTANGGVFNIGAVTLADVTPHGSSAIVGLAAWDSAAASASAAIGAGAMLGVVVFSNPVGDPNGSPIGTPQTLTGWDTLGTDLVMTAVPEPGTLALAGLGVAALLIFRRRK